MDEDVVFRPIGIWVSITANTIAACGGSVFFFTEPGARFRGMEPEAMACSLLTTLAVLLGLFVGLPLSVHDLFRRRMWLCGVIGVVCAFTPLFTSNFISDIAAVQLNLIWD